MIVKYYLQLVYVFLKKCLIITNFSKLTYTITFQQGKWSLIYLKQSGNNNGNSVLNFGADSNGANDSLKAF